LAGPGRNRVVRMPWQSLSGAVKQLPGAMTLDTTSALHSAHPNHRQRLLGRLQVQVQVLTQ
jgi:hypothetical protein